jgi:polyphenol oxidase
MSATSAVGLDARDAGVLYQLDFAGLATVTVTHNAGCASAQTPFAGNLALHVPDDALTVQARRHALQSSLGKPIQWLNQVHGTVVFDCQTLGDIDNNNNNDYDNNSKNNSKNSSKNSYPNDNHFNSTIALTVAPTADAVWTNNPSVAVAVMTADCLPVAFLATNAQGQRAVAVAHAGWRGLQAGVLASTAAALHAGVPNATLHAHLGPCIGVAQFEVGNEVRAAFVEKNSQNARHFKAKAQSAEECAANANPIDSSADVTGGALNALNTLHTRKHLCDLEAIARDELTALGVVHISGGGWCTASDARLASYRRSAKTGRFATLVSLKS